MDNIGFVIMINCLSQALSIKIQPLSHLKINQEITGPGLPPPTHPQTPFVLDLPAEVEVHLGHEEAVPGPAQAGCPAPVRSRHVAGAVEMAEVLVGGLAVTGGKLSGQKHHQY